MANSTIKYPYARGSKSSGSADDFENMSTYTASGDKVSNLPNNSSIFIVFTTWSASNYKMQIAIKFGDGISYIRNRNDGGWNAWKQITN